MNGLPKTFTLDEARVWAREFHRTSNGHWSETAIPAIIAEMQQCNGVSGMTRAEELKALSTLAGEIIRATGDFVAAAQIGYELCEGRHCRSLHCQLAYETFIVSLRNTQGAVAA